MQNAHEKALLEAEGNVTFAYEMLQALKVASERRQAFFGVTYKVTALDQELQNHMTLLHHTYAKAYNELKGK